MATWYAIVRISDKELVSTATVIPPVEERKPEYEYRVLAEKPDFGQKEWDPILDDFKNRPPIVLIDRVDEYKNHKDVKPIWDALPLASQTALESALIEMLGTMRIRGENDSFDIGGVVI